MPSILRQRKSGRQLACRATELEAVLLTKASDLVARGNRNTFILQAALEAARKTLEKHGLTEQCVYDEYQLNSRKK